MTDSSPLEIWFSSLRSRLVDLVGDYAGQELFLVEGDSLLLTCFSDSRLDFEHGFQLLHAVYNVESFLQHLVDRKCHFHITFLDDHKDLCVPVGTPKARRYKYHLARAVIIRHLTIHLRNSHPSIEIHQFASTLAPEFRRYLADSGVYFVMCHDGAGEDSVSTARKSAFRAALWLYCSLGFNVALIAEMEWRDTKVWLIIDQEVADFGLRLWLK